LLDSPDGNNDNPPQENGGIRVVEGVGEVAEL
jgi:hypothetical protein